ncbi:hypothetical protein ANANG_G00072040 [Anguilla anguilla]|uniref:Chemokine interleukin-8-like domain-containing protein n=1 Tax=Anguilla anguilla TaxID=7936 RepID=A0A9D3MQX4_ANGAN|nr:hypothetical protein ANANG_G00072040 [Anguilla anguilla]
MSKLFCLSLLFLLVITWCSSAVESRRRIWQAQPQNECKCKVASNKTLICMRKGMPRSQEQKRDALKCLCKKHRFERKMNVQLRKTCKNIYRDISIPLTLA